jgi:fumarylpyruvate hydrolase
MNAYEQIRIPVEGGGEFGVRRIYCVGRNYRAHLVEMGVDPDREAPFFFLKTADEVVLDGGTVPYPPMTKDFQHEIELVIAIGEGGVNIAEDQALGSVFGYAVGLDMTRRDLQMEARKNGRPWDMGKNFDHAAPCGRITLATKAGPMAKGEISVTVNGQVRQKSDLALMVWNVPEIVSDLSRYVALKAGDLIYTGTPEGVGPVQRGDRLVGHIDGLTALTVTIV